MHAHAVKSERSGPERNAPLVGPAAPQHEPLLQRKQATGSDPIHVSTHAPVARQAKLKIGPAGGALEHEADRVAEQVMRMPDGPGGMSETTAAPVLVQRKAAHADDVTGTTAPPIVHEVLNSPGRPLDTATRAFFEPRFGRDFADVRVHTDGGAAQSADRLNALAYTSGSHVVFGPGQYAPQSASGRGLLGHELAHVAQQQGTLQRKVKFKRENTWYEFGAHWRDASANELDKFVTHHFDRADRKMAKDIVVDMADAGDDFFFDNEAELVTEVTKRMKTSRLMAETQPGGSSATAFGYPDPKGTPLGPRVNADAKQFWGAKQIDSESSYYFELSDSGRLNPYLALTKLFVPQKDKKDRTLIHCDYLASVIHMRVFAETIGKDEFNKRVLQDKIPLTLKWNGFEDIDVSFWHSAKQESLQQVRPSSEKDLVIGDHVVFWNHRAYDLVNAYYHHAWRLENAVLETKNKTGEDVFEGHGSHKRTNTQMRKVLMDHYNDVVKIALGHIEDTKSQNQATRDSGLKSMAKEFEHVPPVVAPSGTTEWRIVGNGTGRKFNEPIALLKNINDPDLTGLRDPEDPTQMNLVWRPKESAQ